MNAMLNAFSRLLLAATLMASLDPGYAATDTATFTVTATVSANCTISATPVAFGAYEPVAGGYVLASGTVLVACTKGATGLTVGLSNGSNFDGSARNMAGVGSDRLAYSLRQPVSAAPGALCPGFGDGIEWTNTAPLTLTSPSGKATRTYNVCGQLAAGQDVSVGNYTDTITATINF